MAAAARQVQAGAQVRHGPVDAQQLVAAAQLLALGVDQQQDGSARVLLHRLQRHFGLRQRQLHADGRVVGRAHHLQRHAIEFDRAADEVALRLQGVRGAEEVGCQGLPVHRLLSFRLRFQGGRGA